MYLLYEHHKDPESGALLATDMLMSSYFPGKPGIAFKRAAENAFFEFTKVTFKAVHIRQRSYDPDTKIWSFFGRAGESVYKNLKDSPLSSVGLFFERIPDLASQVKAGYVGKPEKLAFDPSDFFYTPEPPKSIGPSKAEAEQRLAALLGMSVPDFQAANQRKLYLRGAMLFHPDRNGGDAKQMTELNYYWQVYNA